MHALVQSLVLVVSAAVLVLAFVSVVQWRSASRWRPSLPIFIFFGGVLQLSLLTSSLSLFVRVCFAGRGTTVVKCICWLGFFIYQPPCSRIHRSVSCTSFACAGLLHVGSLQPELTIGFGPCLSDSPPA